MACSRHGYAILFNRSNRRATILASVPWFLQDLGTYGIGIFTPTILAASLGREPDHARSLADLIPQRYAGRQGRGADRLLLLVGIVFAVLLADKFGRITLASLRLHRLRRGALLASFSTVLDGDGRSC